MDKCITIIHTWHENGLIRHFLFHAASFNYHLTLSFFSIEYIKETRILLPSIYIDSYLPDVAGKCDVI